MSTTDSIPAANADAPAREVDSVIAAFGSVTELARALGHRNITTVHGWYRSGRIPPWRRLEIAEAAGRHGVPLPAGFTDSGAPESAGDQAGAGREGDHTPKVGGGDAATNGNGCAALPSTGGNARGNG